MEPAETRQPEEGLEVLEQAQLLAVKAVWDISFGVSTMFTITALMPPAHSELAAQAG